MRCLHAILLTGVLSASLAYGQGFGKSKRKVLLHRKLPAAVHLTGTTVNLKIDSRDPKNSELAQQLSDVLETELLKNDKRLTLEKTRPETLISGSITSFAMPQPQVITRNVISQQKVGRSTQPVSVPQQFYKVNGSLSVAYQAKDVKSGRVLDSDNISTKYSEEFDASGTKTKSWSDMVKKPWKLVPGKHSSDESAPPSFADLQQILVNRVASQIAARLVTTDEKIEVYLARGKLDDTNKLAESGLWSRMLEPLETMTPFPKPEEDAYRLYNIGVAYEALAYQAEDVKAAKKFFEQAAINYGKAIDANPHEKYFLEPQNRIQTAMAHYKKLEQRNASGSRPQTQEPQKASAADRSVPAPRDGAGGPLTNEQVIKLAQAGLDEENLIATIKQAPSVQFDFSVDAQVRLAQNGIKGKILTAMREKAAQTPRRRSPAASKAGTVPAVKK